MSEKEKQKEHFYRSILALKDEAECADFFKDVCTVGELEAIVQRVEVARRLEKGEVYTEIMQEVNTSSATISRVKRMLRDGTGCVSRVLARVADDTKD